MRPSLVTTCTLLAVGLLPASGQEPGSSPPTPPASVPEGVETVASRDGTRIAYERAGAGPVVVLVSGALSGRESLALLAGLLAESFTVVTYDRRGRGASGDTPPYAVAREVDDLEALVDATGGRAFLLGVSSGAVLALEAANGLGEKVRGAALFEPPFVVDDARPPIPPDFFDGIAALLAEGRRDDAVATFMADGVGVPEEQLAAMRRSPMWAALVRLAHTLPYDGALLDGLQDGRPLPPDRWRSVVAPVVVLDGDRSPAFLRNAASALAGVVPGAEHRSLRGCDHAAPFLAPDAFLPVLSDLAQAAQEDPPEPERP